MSAATKGSTSLTRMEAEGPFEMTAESGLWFRRRLTAAASFGKGNATEH